MLGLVAVRKMKGGIAEMRGGQPLRTGGGDDGVDGGSNGNRLRIRSGDDGGILLMGNFFLALLLFLLHPSEGSEWGGVSTFG